MRYKFSAFLPRGEYETNYFLLGWLWSQTQRGLVEYLDRKNKVYINAFGATIKLTEEQVIRL